MTKQNLPNSSGSINNLTSEMNYYNQLYATKPRTGSGSASFVSTTSGITYSTETYNNGIYAGQGQEGLLLVLQNALEDYLISANDFNNKIDINNYVQTVPYAVASGSSNSYLVSLSPAPFTYVDGMAIAVKINVTCTGSSTLNINGLGAKTIKDSEGNDILSGGLKAGIIYTFRYEVTSGNFISQTKKGGGNATSAQLLKDATATVDSGYITGNMPNNPSPTTTITTHGGTKSIPLGYSPNGTVTASYSNFSAGVIAAGTIVGGVVGTFTSDANAIASQILAGLYAYVNGSKIIGTMVNHTGADSVANGIAGTSAGRIYVRPQAGYYDGSVASYVDDTNFQPTNILSGKSILGLVGTAQSVPTTGLIAGGNILYNGYVASSISITKLSGTVTLSGYCVDNSTWYSGGSMPSYSITVSKNGASVGSLSAIYVGNQVNSGPSLQMLSDLNVSIAPGDTLSFSRVLNLYIKVGNTIVGTI